MVYFRDEYKQNALHEYIATAEKKQAEFVREVSVFHLLC